MSVWKRSSQCSSGACLETCRLSPMILVRDSKNPGVYQAWTPNEWRGLLGCVKVGWRPEGVRELVDGCVEVGLERHDDKLTFTAAEWATFTKAVENGEFEIDKLPEFTELSSPAAETGVSPAPGRTVDLVTGQTPCIGARRGHDPTSNLPVSRDLPEDQVNHAAAGAGEAGVVGAASTRPAPVAATLNVPAGRIADPPSADLPTEAGQPGLTNLQRVYAVVESQIRLGGSKTEIAEAIVADLQEGGLIVDDPIPVSDPDKLLRQAAAPLVPAVETQETGS